MIINEPVRHTNARIIIIIVYKHVYVFCCYLSKISKEAQ